MGDLDPSCLPETLAPLREAVQVRVAVIEGADHAFAASDLHSEEDLTQAAMQALANWMPLRPQG
jgi:dienelactone hydrolase